MKKLLKDCTIGELCSYCDSQICCEGCDYDTGAPTPKACKLFGNAHPSFFNLCAKLDIQDPQAVPFDRDFETILQCAHRYAMGRETYMPHLVMDYTRPLLPYLSNNFLNRFLEDIKLQKRITLGAACDEHDWLAFETRVKKELERREDHA